MRMIRHNLHLIDFAAVIYGYLAQSTFANFAIFRTMKYRIGMFGLPNKMVSVLTNSMFGMFQI